jgi:hypothetical protein
LEGLNAELSFPVTLGLADEYGDPPHALRLLRARRQGPGDRRAAEQGDELASPHVEQAVYSLPEVTTGPLRLILQPVAQSSDAWGRPEFF